MQPVVFGHPHQFRMLKKTPRFAMTCSDSTKQRRESRPAQRVDGRGAPERAIARRRAVPAWGAKEPARRFKDWVCPRSPTAAVPRATTAAMSQKVLAALRAAV